MLLVCPSAAKFRSCTNLIGRLNEWRPEGGSVATEQSRDRSAE